MKYRPEIDGLRAIAVLAVIIYHAEFVYGESILLPGGFLGVDVFFVISGYLISTIIISGLQKKEFSLFDFYERRARRILPVLFVVMATTLPFAWLYIEPKEMMEYAGSGLASLGFASNFWFWWEDSYNAAPSQLKPLLHTWSLSVEEQFYLLFPVLAIVVFRYRARITITIYALFMFSSLCFAQYWSDKYIDANFFLLPSRAWELLAGVFLAVKALYFPAQKQFIWNDWMPKVGLVLILSSLLVMDDTMPHPSFFTVLPVLGTVLMIAYARQGEFVTGLLSIKPMVMVGLISYGLYLWHFPLFAFSRIRDSIDSNQDRIELIVASVLLACLSYWLVEKPMRNKSQIKTTSFFIVIGVVFFLLLSTFTWLRLTDGAIQRIPSDIAKVVDFNYWNKERQLGEFTTHPGCTIGTGEYQYSDPFYACKKMEKPESARPSIMVIGDSHAESLMPGIIKYYANYANVYQRVVPACIPLMTMLPKGHTNNCHHHFSFIYQELAQTQPDVVIIAGRWRNQMMGHLDLQIRKIQELTDSTVFLNGPLPYWKPQLPKKIAAFINERPLEDITRMNINPNTYTIDHMMAAVAQRRGIQFLSPVQAFCNEKRKCLTKINNTPQGMTTWDNEHLTADSSKFLIKHYVNDIDAALGINGRR